MERIKRPFPAGVRVAGLGVWLPEHVRMNDAWPPEFSRGARGSVSDQMFSEIELSQDPESTEVLARCLAAEEGDPYLGVIERRIAPAGMPPDEAEANASLAALADAGIDPADVDVVLTQSILPDHPSPGSAPGVVRRIGARGAIALGTECACATSIVDLEIGAGMIASGLAEVVLVAQSHCVANIFPLSHPMSPGIGDAAVAVVLAKRGRYILQAVASTIHPEFERAVAWVRGRTEETDHRWWKAGGPFLIGSRDPVMGKTLLREMVTYGVRSIREVSQRAGIDPTTIDLLACAQPRGFLPRAMAEVLGMSSDRAPTTHAFLAHVGGCGSICNLIHAEMLGMVKPGMCIALYGQGAGFTRAAALLRRD